MELNKYVIFKVLRTLDDYVSFPSYISIHNIIYTFDTFHLKYIQPYCVR